MLNGQLRSMSEKMPAVTTKSQSETVTCLIKPDHWAFGEWNPDHCTITFNGFAEYFVYDHHLRITIAYSENYPALTRWLSRQG